MTYLWNRTPMLNYRSEIDGLRALAVIPVVLFHAGFELFSGGYVGVDVFFVISGYLITSILIRDLQTSGISLLQFYERRARRILPALLFVTIVCVPFSYWWMLPQELKDFSQSLIGVATFSSNVLFWMETNYFAGTSELKPLLHTWSLAVEEQFYLIFPLLLLATSKTPRAWLVSLCILMAGLSLSISIIGTTNFPSANFYLLPSRFWELLIGAIIALTSASANQPKRSLVGEALAVVGLFGILASALVLDSSTPYPGLHTVPPVLGTMLVLIFASDQSIAARLLRFKPLVGIGLISYSLYLWHQPIFAFARLNSWQDLSELYSLGLISLSVSMAWLSWKFIEAPFRDKKKYSRKSIWIMSATALSLVLVVGLLGHFSGGMLLESTEFRSKQNEIGFRTRTNFGLSKDCELRFHENPNCRTGENPEVLVWGDSYAMHLVEAVKTAHPNATLLQATKNACPPILGISFKNKTRTQEMANECIAFNKQVSEYIRDNSNLRYVIVSSRLDQLYNPESSIVREKNEPKSIAEATIETLTMAQTAGVEVVFVGPTPSNDLDLGRCLAISLFQTTALEECDFPIQDILMSGSVKSLLNQISKEFQVIDLQKIICHDRVCHASIDGVLLYRDGGHLSVEGSSYIGTKTRFIEVENVD